MEKYGLDNIYNIVLLSHGGAGKTTLAEAMLFNTGAVSRLGKVDDGSSASDYDPDEVKHQISINLSLLPFEWQDAKVNLLDTPGYMDFVGEVKAAIRVSEGAVVIASAASGLEVGTELTWNYSAEAGQSRIIFVNKMDRENASFDRTVEQCQSRFGNRCVPIQMPIVPPLTWLWIYCS